MLKRVILLFVCVVAFAQNGFIAPHNAADFTGDNAVHQMFPTGGSARWVVVVTQSTAVNVRIGDSSVSSTVGFPMPANFGFMFPPVPADPRQPLYLMQMYDLSKIYYYAATGDKLSVMWGN